MDGSWLGGIREAGGKNCGAAGKSKRPDHGLSQFLAPSLSCMGFSQGRLRAEFGGAIMPDRQSCRFFVLRYSPDAIKNEFINIGLVLLPPAGMAEVRFTHDWSRVRCLDPQADVEMLEAMENDLREKLHAMN